MPAPDSPALVIVDMQNYYLSEDSDFSRYSTRNDPDALDYIRNRAREVSVPVIEELRQVFRNNSWPVLYLRLCGRDPERQDLHRLFRETWERGRDAGFPAIYPLADEPDANILEALAPIPGEAVFTKTTFSGFNSGDFAAHLENLDVKTLVFTGLATSQCVDTTARDASDRGYGVFQIEDGLCDYTQDFHYAALFASQGVCGGNIMSGAEFLTLIQEHSPQTNKVQDPIP